MVFRCKLGMVVLAVLLLWVTLSSSLPIPTQVNSQVVLSELPLASATKDFSPNYYANHALDHCRTNHAAYKNINDFDVKWFLTPANQKPEVIGHFENRTLFYTAGMSTAARCYARAKDYITIWDVWAEELYDGSATATNPFSCIHNDKKLRQIFFRHMSEAYATLAQGAVIVMHKRRQYFSPPANGIWALVERTTIKANAKVNMILKLNQQDARSLVVTWRRGAGDVLESLNAVLDDLPTQVKSLLGWTTPSTCLLERYIHDGDIDW